MTTETPAPALDMARISRAWRALMAYRGLSLQVFDAQALSFEALPDAHQALIADVPVRLSHAAEAVEHNADVAELVASVAGIAAPFDPAALEPDELEAAVADFPDVVDALLAVARDWSAAAEKERALAYEPILRAVEEAAEDVASAAGAESPEEFAILVPGASLGRLAWELARNGYTVQGVESSYLQLFMCNFILNGAATSDKPLHLYPFAHHTGMVQSMDEQVREVEFPDVDPHDVASANFSMVAGEFLELYDEEESWDCVVTCFCVENSHSIISYVRRIAKILKTGGVWVNHGSLDFRFDDSLTEPSVEVTLEELDLIMARSGLRVVTRENLRCRPPFAVQGMINEEYGSTFTVAARV